MTPLEISALAEHFNLVLLIQCSHCSTTLWHRRTTAHNLALTAAENGWSLVSGKPYCPDCKPAINPLSRANEILRLVSSATSPVRVLWCRATGCSEVLWSSEANEIAAWAADRGWVVRDGTCLCPEHAEQII